MSRPSTPIRYAALPDRWPGRPIEKPIKDPFRVVTWSQAEKLFQKELWMHGARDVELAIDIRDPRYFRSDGGIRADARPASSAVVLSFTGKDGNRLTFPCATYGDWVVNVYAIAKSLENLRAVDRYGVTQGDAQYVGFKALPAPKPEGMTPAAAAITIARASGIEPEAIVAFKMVFESAAKIAQRKTHPDNGGSDTTFGEVMTATEVLDRKFGNG